MSSSVFYKFKNSKEPERIVFDGTGISVFELKREIITASGLGDGSDFDLHLYPEDNLKSEYDDDTTIISRSSTVVATRRPAARGHGRAARYISGRAPVRAIKKADAPKPVASTPGGALTEQDAEAAFLAESAQVWAEQKESLSHAKPVFNNHKKKQVNVPTHDPPPGYVCYRCQKKGHWIMACPTNDDPDFKPVARAKRTTGIPRSFLTKVEKPAEGDEDARGVMLNADGEYVQVMADTRTWEKFQEKANASKAQAANADAANKEMEERGLVCPIDKRMFVEPVKTPCCGKTYCHDCIENALADGDLVCPNCSTDGVLIDDLVSDEDMVGRMREYEAEKSKEKVDKNKEDAKVDGNAPLNNETDVSVTKDAAADEKKSGEKVAADSAGAQSPKSENAIVVAAAGDESSTENVKEMSSHTVAALPTSDPTLSTTTGTPGPDGKDKDKTTGNASDSDTSSTSRKRKEPPTVIAAPTAPKAMRMKKELESRQQLDQSSAMEKEFIESMEALKNLPKGMPIVGPGMGVGINPLMAAGPGMGMPGNMNVGMGVGAMGMPMGGMPMGGVNGMGMQMPMGGYGMGGGWGMNGGGMNGGMNGMNGYGGGFQGQNGYNGYGNQNQNQYGNMQHGNQGMNGYNNMQGQNGYPNQQHQNQNQGWNNGGNQGYGNQGYGAGAMGQGQQNGMGVGAGVGGAGGFANQQQNNSQDAYERRPLNPHRQGRRKARAPDFHYVG